MPWQSIEGHDEVVEQFRRSLTRNRLASTFLFAGPAGIGKRTFALGLAKALLCQTQPEALSEPCGRCAGCVQVAAGTHPDLEIISKPPDKSFIPLAAFIGDEGQRMREGLCHHIALKPFMGGRKIAIIDDADYLNEEGANSLLKTLEEPPPRSVLILIGTSSDKQLPTIRSRSQIIRFRPLARDAIARLLISQGLASSPAEAERLAEHADGSLERATELADAELWSFRQQLLGRLSRADFDSVALSRQVVEFVDAAGKEASARRVRSRQVIGFAAEFYRQLLRSLSGASVEVDRDLDSAVEHAAGAWRGDAETAARCLDRTMEALGHIDRNANQSTLVECWLDDLSRIETAAAVQLI